MIKGLAKSNNYPKIYGSQEDINQFLTTLIRTQKSLHDWRDFPKKLIEQIRYHNQINTVSLNKKYPPEIITKDVPEWATYEEDKIVSNFIDELGIKQIQYLGTRREIAELVFNPSFQPAGFFSFKFSTRRVF